MKTNEVHKFDINLKKLIDETGYKHLALESQDGERLVSYNSAKSPLKNKWEEIRKRLPIFPDGFYRILATTSLGGKNKPDVFIIQKGNPPAENLQEEQTPRTSVHYIQHPKTKEDSSRDKILSLDEALARIKELSELRVENEMLKNKVKEQDEYILELENDLDEAESKPLSDDSSSAGGWVEKTLPSVMPFIEQYFANEKEKNEIARLRLQPKQNKKPIVISSNRRRANAPADTITFLNMDLTDDNQVNQLLDELEAMSDADFENAFELISQKRPELAQIIADEFQMETEENNE